MSKIIEKELIDKCWDLSKRSWEDEKALEGLKEINKDLVEKLKNFIILYVDNYNSSNDLRDYYSFYRIYNLRGEYLFAFPSHGLNFPESEWKVIMNTITHTPNNPNKSSNGGDYYSGYRIWKLTHPKVPNEIYKVAYNRMLNSDFQEQGWEEPELCYSIQEIAEMTGETIDIKNSI